MSEKAKKKLSLPSFGPQEIVTLLFAAAIFLINFRVVGKCYNPFVFNDEMGYWTHASVMAGYDWTGVSNGLAWYSYGYSFMLAPIMKLFSDPVDMYRAALILNIVMEVLVYFMYIYIIRFLAPELKKIPASLISATAVLYTSYQHNAGIAFSETALLFVTTLTAFTLVRVLKKPSYLNLGCLGAVSAYLFMVHNRTIGIVASVVLVVFLAVIFKKIKLRHAAVFLGVLAMGFVADKLIRHHLESILWYSGKAGGNDSESILSKLRSSVSSTANFKRMMSLFVSQAFAAFVSTFGIALFALWAILRRMFENAALSVKAAAKHKKRQAVRAINSQFFMLLFIFCAFISTWLISSVFMFEFQRIDHIVYTRYYDITIGLLIITGLYYMYHANKADFMFAAVMPFIMLAGANRAAGLFNSVGIKIFSRVCSPGLGMYYHAFENNYYAYAMTAAAMFGVLMFIMQIKKHDIGLYPAALITTAAFIVFTSDAREDIRNNQRVYKGDRELVYRVKDMEPEHIYIAPDVGTFASFLQFMMKDVKVEYANHPERLSEDALIFVDKRNIIEMRDYEIIDRSDRHLLVRNTKTAADEDFHLPLSYMYTFDSDMYIADEDMIKSDPDNNYLCYGPYLGFDADQYTLTLDMTVLENTAENIGFAEVKSNSVNTVYDHVEITSDMVKKDGSISLDLGANVGVPVSDMEIVVFLYDPKAVSMQLNSIEVNTED